MLPASGRIPFLIAVVASVASGCGLLAPAPSLMTTSSSPSVVPTVWTGATLNPTGTPLPTLRPEESSVSAATASPTIGPTKPPASATTPQPTPAPTFGPLLNWGGGALPRQWAEASLGGGSTDVTVGGPGFVIVGWDFNSGRRPVAAAWTSVDGLAWQEHLVELGLGDTWGAVGGPGFHAVAASGAALIALGPVGIWRSTDGVSWERAVEPQAINVPLRDVAWGPAGFVVIGPAGGPDAETWRSDDGRDWLWDPASPALSGFCPGMVAGGPLGYTAIGSDCADPERPVIVASTDGSTWSRAPSQSSLSGALYRGGVAAGGPGWIAFGRFTPSGAQTWGTQFWVSADGLAWRRTAFLPPSTSYVPCPAELDNAWMLDIAPFAGGYVGVGTSSYNNDPHGAAWASPDGVSWHSLCNSTGPSDFVFPMNGVAANSDRLVVAGSTGYIDYLPYAYAATVSSNP